MTDAAGPGGPWDPEESGPKPWTATGGREGLVGTEPEGGVAATGGGAALRTGRAEGEGFQAAGSVFPDTPPAEGAEAPRLIR
jgi:hypothetical protein